MTDETKVKGTKDDKKEAVKPSENAAKTLWVVSGTGKPVGFSDRSGKEQYTAYEITQEMVEKGIGIEVPDNDFFRGKVNEKLLAFHSDPAKAKADYNAWLKSRPKPEPEDDRPHPRVFRNGVEVK